MWLATEAGTVYVLRQGVGEYYLLAHARADLETLRQEAGLKSAVVEAEDGGFSHRMSAAPSEVLSVLACLDGSMELDDFRALLSQAGNIQARERICRLTWSMMQRLLMPMCAPGGMALSAHDITELEEAWQEMWEEEGVRDEG